MVRWTDSIVMVCYDHFVLGHLFSSQAAFTDRNFFIEFMLYTSMLYTSMLYTSMDLLALDHVIDMHIAL